VYVYSLWACGYRHTVEMPSSCCQFPSTLDGNCYPIHLILSLTVRTHLPTYHLILPFPLSYTSSQSHRHPTYLTLTYPPHRISHPCLKVYTWYATFPSPKKRPKIRSPSSEKTPIQSPKKRNDPDPEPRPNYSFYLHQTPSQLKTPPHRRPHATVYC
jgi:hypothetical protein